MALTRVPRLVQSAVTSRTARFASSTADLKLPPLHADHLADGGKMVDFAGWSMPVEYNKDLSIIDSCKWTRSNASLFDVSHMCSLRWTGKDAVAFVERVTTMDIQGLPMMQGGLTVIPNAHGGIIDDTMVTKATSKEHGDHLYQVINAGCADKDIRHFEEELGRFGGDVKMEVLDRFDRGLFAIQGPKAVDVVQRLVPGTDLSKVAFGQSLWLDLLGFNCFVSRCGYTGEDGFEVYVPPEGVKTIWAHLKAQEEVRLAGLAARDSLRLEAGLCLYGNDIDADTTPIEAGLTWVVGKSRRDPNAANQFIGSERILAQITDKTQVKKLRAGLISTKGPPARAGAKILTTEGEEVGTVTSGSLSPCLSASGTRTNISMGYINKPHNKRDTNLQVDVRGRKFPFTTTKMPFVPTKYYKP